MKKLIIFLLILSGCSHTLNRDELRLVYFSSCKNTTLRLCNWEDNCIWSNIVKCEIESEDFATAATSHVSGAPIRGQ